MAVLPTTREFGHSPGTDGERAAEEFLSLPPPQVAVLIPCLNEETAVGKVVADFRAALPHALIFVYDNGSVDRTALVAREAGAIVRREPLRGKGNVMRRMFADIDADVYVLVDGDGTYDAASAPTLVTRLLEENADMVNGARQEQCAQAYRRGHRFGNRILTALVSYFFGEQLTDMLSGYRVLSRRFVKSFPALASGFEIETELTVHALQLHLPIIEVVTPYRDRPPASASKLRTIPDGVRILRLIARLVREERPLEFFSSVAALMAITSLLLIAPIVREFLRTGLVPRLPTAVLSTGLMLVSCLSLACGLILATVTRGRIEAKRLRYLQISMRRERSDRHFSEPITDSVSRIVKRSSRLPAASDRARAPKREPNRGRRDRASMPAK